MYGGVRTGLALVLGLSIAAGIAPANAADLGGDCCSDLEERIAELESTTARKGNRKVSLEVSGHINEAVLWWDDGAESNAYVVTNDNQRSRFRFKGKAKIDNDWEAGYQIEIGVRAANSKRFTQLDPTGGANNTGLDLRDSYWYLKSKKFGRLSVGNQGTATDQITEVNLSQTSSFAKYSDIEDTGLGLFLRSKANGRLANALTWRQLIGDAGDQPGEGERRFNSVKYVSPEFAGFTASAAWGQDDYWDVALDYQGEHGGFLIAAGIGYGEITDNAQTQTVCSFVNGIGAHDTKCRQFGGSISVLHKDTGLFANFGAGIKTDDQADVTALGQAGASDEQTFWAAQAGIERKFNEYGKTTIYGEYYNYDGGGNNRRTVAANDAINPFGNAVGQIWSSGVTSYGAGIAQGIDKASLVLYLSYRHVEADLNLRNANNGAIAAAPLDDLDLVLSGAIIKF